MRYVRFIWRSKNYHKIYSFHFLQSYLSSDGAADREIHVNIRFGGDILKVDCSVMFILGFAEVERKLIVNGEVVVAALIHRVTEVMVLSVALLAVVPRHT